MSKIYINKPVIEELCKSI